MERFRDECVKILKSKKPSVGLKLLEKTGILSLFIPEFDSCRNCIQGDKRGFHDFDVLDHLFYACDGAVQEKLNVRLAALFHDIGKPDTKRVEECNGEQIFTFYNHDAEIDSVVHLVKEHMFFYQSSWSNAAVRRFIVRAKKECIEDLFDLRLADVYGMHNAPVAALSPTVLNLNELSDRIKAIEEENSALSLKDLAINGSDLIKMGIKPGKKLGWLLNELLECVLDNPSANTKENLLEIAEKISERCEI